MVSKKLTNQHMKTVELRSRKTKLKTRMTKLPRIRKKPLNFKKSEVICLSKNDFDNIYLFNPIYIEKVIILLLFKTPILTFTYSIR